MSPSDILLSAIEGMLARLPRIIVFHDRDFMRLSEVLECPDTKLRNWLRLSWRLQQEDQSGQNDEGQYDPSLYIIEESPQQPRPNDACRAFMNACLYFNGNRHRPHNASWKALRILLPGVDTTMQVMESESQAGSVRRQPENERQTFVEMYAERLGHELDQPLTKQQRQTCQFAIEQTRANLNDLIEQARSAGETARLSL